MTLFGSIVSPYVVETAVLETLSEWLPEYLAEIERQQGFAKRALGRPPVPESYHGGLDWLSVAQARCPEVIAIVNPADEVERHTHIYVQNFGVQIGCVVFSEETAAPEDFARRNAGFFAAAVMGVLTQQSGLNKRLSGEIEVLMTGSPKLEFWSGEGGTEDRRVAMGITTWAVRVPVINANAGPVLRQTPTEEPYPEWPEVKTHTGTVKGEPISEPIS